MCNRCGGHDTGSVTVSPSEASRGHFRKEQKRERYLCSPTDKIKTYPTDCWLRNAVRGHAQTFYYYAKRHERKKISSGREPQLKDFYYPIGLALVAEKNHDDSSVFFYRTSEKGAPRLRHPSDDNLVESATPRAQLPLFPSPLLSCQTRD
jgi:hypothetical protein